jgi:hypothetical protein
MGKAAADQTTLANELETAYRTNGGSEKGVDYFQRMLNPALPLSTRLSNAREMASLVMGKRGETVNKLNRAFPQGMGLNLPMDPEAQQALATVTGTSQSVSQQLQTNQQAAQKTTMDVDPSMISKGLIEPGNIQLKGRPLINMPGGSVGSEYSVSFTQDGKEVLVPTIFDGKAHNPQDAWKHYLQTGQHLGKYDNVADADRAAEAIHSREYASGGSLDQTRSTQAPNTATPSIRIGQPAIKSNGQPLPDGQYHGFSVVGGKVSSVGQ